MKNPQLMLKKEGRRFRVVIVGDTYQGPKRGILYVPGQPREGFSKAEAEKLAEQWGPSRVISFAAAREGSYVYPKVRPKLVALSNPFRGGVRKPRPEGTPENPRPTPSVSTPAPRPALIAPVVHVDETERAARLLEARRSALKAIAAIDGQLAELIGAQSTAVIQAGMSRPVESSITFN